MIPSIAQDPLEPGSESVPSHDNFLTLVSELSRILGPSSGLTSEDVDIEKLTRRMQSYISNAKEWSKYAFSDFSRGYTRNLVDEGNGKSNLLVLVWSPGKGSPVHDHADAHCLIKILKGTLKETKFNYPKNNATPPEIIQETIYKENQVTYMSDDLGIHKISNPDPHNVAVSLHLYTPPNAAREGCYIFNEESGKRSHVTQSNFFSVQGCKTSSL